MSDPKKPRKPAGSSPRGNREPTRTGGASLSRFGIDPNDGASDRNMANIFRFMRALLNNPNLLIGRENSLVVFPDTPAAPLARAATGDPLQFKVYGVRVDEGTYYAKVRAGYVRNIDPASGATEPVKDWMPLVGATPLNDTVAPEITIADGQTVYCRVPTDTHEVITADPTIVVAATPEAGTHYQPNPAGTNGDLYLPIANIDITDGTVTITQIQQGGPILIRPNLWEGENVGGEREIFKERDTAADNYKFRTLKQLTGDGEPVIKDLAAEEEEADFIPFRRIAPRVTAPQIQIEDDGDVMRVRGNGYDQNFTGLIKNLTVVDGLVTGFEEATPGGDLNVTVNELTWLNDGGVMTYVSFYSGTVHYWRGGLYIGTTDPMDSPVGLIEQTVTKMIETS